MKTYSVTIAREYGSGGRLIGKQLASELGIGFYDKELIVLAARESGLHEDFIETMDQKKASSFFYNLYMPYNVVPIPEQIFLAQSKAIKDLAERESCVIIGRCGDYVLGDVKNCVRIFIHAPMEYRVELVKKEYQEGGNSPVEFIRKQDKYRASYYDFFTQHKWGRAQNYNICLDSSIGIAKTVGILKTYIEEYISKAE
ncbi:MAG: cytidylate kinase-like family protein [Synergistaceae bacterium]|jgi:cytidylate kinase|nr:cytidylate kinase-like family protein [Synergistaceae bacterium]